MRKWLCITPVLLLSAACSKTTAPHAVNSAACPPGNVCNNAPAAPANLAGANPEPVAPPAQAAAGQPAASPGQGNSVVVASQPYGSSPRQQAYVAPQPEAVPQPQPPDDYADRSGEPAASPAPAPAYAERAEPIARTNQATMFIPRGTRVRVRIDQEVDTRHNRAGDRFSATLYEPVVVSGATVLPTGTRFRGHLVASKSSGRLRGRAVLGLTLDSFRYNGRDYRIDTSGAYRESGSHKRRNFALIGGGGGLGAAIGAIAGGGQGAAIGAASGVGAGLAGAAITGKKQVAVAAEAPLTFTLRAPVRI